MFDHVTLRAADRAASAHFYGTVLTPLGLQVVRDDGEYHSFGGFSVAPATPELPTTTGLHIGFAAPSTDAIDAFWQAGVEAGFRSDGPPGPRPQYSADYYGAFLLDPDGNSAEAARHSRLREGRGPIDHLWIGVCDVAASRAFYDVVAQHGGFAVAAEQPGLVRFRGPRGGSFTLIAGRQPTAGLHMAFGVSDEASVDAFHAELVAAGYRDHGAPGLRPRYAPNYYGAFVLDPDGNNIELVHHRPHGPGA